MMYLLSGSGFVVICNDGGVGGRLEINIKGEAGDDSVGVGLMILILLSGKLMWVLGWVYHPLLSHFYSVGVPVWMSPRISCQSSECIKLLKESVVCCVRLIMFSGLSWLFLLWVELLCCHQME